MRIKETFLFKTITVFVIISTLSVWSVPLSIADPDPNTVPTDYIPGYGNSSFTADGAHGVFRSEGGPTTGSFGTYSIGSNAVIDNYIDVAALATVRSGSPSEIFGAMNNYGPGKFFLVNTNGIYFAPGSQVNASGLVASSLNISQEDFKNGNYKFFQGAGNAGVVRNEGNMKIGPGGLALLGGAVENLGFIQADESNVVMASGKEMTLSFDPQGLVSVLVDKGVSEKVFDKNGVEMKNGVANKTIPNKASGVIRANGGKVYMTTEAAKDVFEKLVNNEGLVEANTIANKNGVIELVSNKSEGIVANSGTLNAKGDDLGEKGGTVKVLGEKVGLFAGTKIDASGYSGGGTVLVGGNYQGLGSERNADATYIDADAVIKADALLEGNGGTIVVWSDNSTRAYGSLSARGGILSGDGGLIETSSKNFLDTDGALIDASAVNGKAGTWLLDPLNITISNGSQVNGSFNGASPDVFIPSANNSVVKASDINTRLNAGTSVKVTTNGSASSTITLDSAAAILKSVGNNTVTFTLEATKDILLNGTIGATVGILNVILNAGGKIDVSNNISTHGGNINATAVADITFPDTSNPDPTIVITTLGGIFSAIAGGRFNMDSSNASITTSGGAVNITAGTLVNTDGAINSGAGSIDILSTGDDVNIGNALTTTGGNITLTSVKSVSLDNGLTDVTTGGGKFTVNADSDDNGAGSFTKTNTGSSVLTSGGDIAVSASAVDINGAFNSGAGKINLTSKTASLKVSSSLTTNGGDITLSGKTDVLLDNANSDIATSGGKFTATANGGNFNQSNAGGTISTGAGDVSLTAKNDVILKGTTTTSTGKVDATATTSQVIVSNAITTSGGDVTFNAADGVSLDNANSDIATSGGKFTARNNTDNDTTGTFDMGNAGGSIDTSVSGNGGAIDISGLVVSLDGTLNSGTKNIDLTATTGAVTIGNAITTSGGDVTLTAADGVALSTAASDILTNGGKYTVSANTDNDTTGTYSQSNAGSAVNTSGGAAWIKADDFSFSGTHNTGLGSMTLLASTAGQTIGLGTTKNITITAAELQTITSNNLIIGDSTNGDITVRAITAANSANISKVTLNSTAAAGSVTFDSSASNFKSLDVNAGNGILIDTNVTTTTSPSSFNADSDGAGTGTFTINSGFSLNTTGKNLTIGGKDFNAAGTSTINAGAATVSFNPTAATTIGLGSASGTFNISDSEADRITAGTLDIGNASSGNMTIDDFSPLNAPTLILRTGGSIKEGTPDSGVDVKATNLAVYSGTGVDVDTQVSKLAFNNSTSGNVVVDNTGALTIDSVGGIATSKNDGGNTNISSKSPLTVNANIIQNGGITLSAGETAAAGDNLTVNSGVTVQSNLSNVTLQAGDDINLQANSNVIASAGDVTLTAGSGNTDSFGSLNIAGVVTAATNAFLSAFGAINQTAGTISATNLNFNAGNAVNLNQAGNRFSTVNGNAGGLISVANSDSNTEVKNLTTVGNSITYNHTGTGDVTVTGTVSSGSAVVNGGTVQIKSDNALTVANTATINTSAGSGGSLTISGATVSGALIIGAGNVVLNGGVAGSVLDTIINTPLLSNLSDIFISAIRDIIIQSSVTTTGTGNISLVSDSNLDGVGGVWIQGAGSVNSAGNVTATGSDVFGTAPIESILIDADGGNNQILAQGDITLQKSSVAPSAADMIINGRVNSAGAGKTIAIDSANNITTSNDGAAELIGDKLKMSAVSGIDVETDVNTVAFLNTTSGNVSIEDMAGGLTVGTVGTMVGGTNNGSGSTTISTHSPLTIAANMIQAGAINLLAGESGATTDHLTINSGVTVQSTAGDVTLNAGDNVILGSNSVIQSNAGKVTVAAGSGDTDNAGNLSIGGVINAATDAILSAFGTITGKGTGATDVAADKLSMTSGAGIGTAPLDIQTASDLNGFIQTSVNNVEANGGTGEVLIKNNKALTIGGTSAGLTGLSGGNRMIAITTGATGGLTVNEAVTNSSNNETTLGVFGTDVTNDVIINADVTGAGDVTLFAGDSVIVNAGKTVSATGTSGVSVMAGVDFSDFDDETIQDGSATGDVLLNGAIQAASGSVKVSAIRDVFLNTITTPSDVTVTATNGQINDNNAGVTNVTADSINANASTGISLDMNVNSISAKSATGNVAINEVDGATIENVEATAGDATVISSTGNLVTKIMKALGVATIRATNGAITNGAAAGVKNVTADKLAMTAGTGIGTAPSNINVATDLDGLIQTSVNNVEADGGTGSVLIKNDKALTIGGASAGLTGISSADRVIVLTAGATGGLTVNEAVTNSGNETSLGAFGSDATNDVTVNADVTSTGGGDVMFFAGDTVTVNAGKTVSTTGSGSVSATAGVDFSDFDDENILDGSSTGDVVLNGAIQTGSGSVDLKAVRNVDLNTVTTTGDVTVTATNGQISDNNAALNNVTANNLTATAATGIDLDTNITNLNATVTGVGNIDISEANDLNVQTLAAANGTANIKALAGTITYANTISNLASLVSAAIANIINAKITTTGSQDFSGNMDVNEDLSAGSSLTIHDATTVDLAANVDLTANNGVLSVSNNVGSINLSGGAGTTNILTSKGDAALTLAPVTSSGNANLTVASDGDVTLGNVNIGSTGNLTVDVDNDDDGGNTGTFGNITSNGLTVRGHNALSANENFTFNGAISISGDLDMGGVSTLIYNSDVTAKSINLHDISNRIQLGQDVDLKTTNGALNAFSNVNTILLAGATGTNIFESKGDSSVNLSGITATNSPNLTVNSEGNVTVASVNINNGTFNSNADNDGDTVNVQTVLGALNAGIININGGNGTDDVTLNGAITSSTGAISILAPENLDVNADITSATSLTISEANTVDLGDNVDLTANNGALTITNNIGGIVLSGISGTTNLIQSLAGGGAVTLAAITTATALNNPNLTVNSTGNITLASADINGGTLNLNLDTNNNSSNTLTTGLLRAGAINVEGSSNNDDAIFNGTLTAINGGITINDLDLVDINQDVTAATFVTISDANTVDLAGGVDINANAGTVNITNAIGTINLSGASGSLVSINSIGGNVTLDDITANNNANLTVNSQGDITLQNVDINAGALTVQADNNSDGSNTLIAGTLTAGAINLSGGTDNNELINLTGDVSGTSITIQRAATVDLAANVDLTTSNGNLNVNSNVGSINLSGVTGTNVIAGNGDANSVNLGAVNSATNRNLTVTSDGSISIASANIGTGALNVTADADNDNAGKTLNAGALTAGAVTLSGGTDNNDLINLTGNVTAGTSLNIQRATVVDLAANVNLTATNGNLNVNSNVGTINLSGATGTNVIDGNGDANAVNLAVITDTNGNNPNLIVNSEGNLTLAGANTLGTGTYTFTSDNDNDSTSILAVNGAISGNATLTFQGGGTGTNDTLDINASIAGNALTIQNILVADLASGVNLTASNGNLNANSNVGTINLSGAAGTNTITGNGDANAVNLATITDSANASLTVSSQGNLSLAGANALGNGTYSFTADSNNNSASVLAVNGQISGNSALTLQAGGTGTGDTLDVNANISSNTLTIQNFNLVDLAGGVNLTNASGNLNANSNVGSINLSGANGTTNTIDGNGDGSVNLAAITATNNANLTVNSEGNINIVSANINGGTLNINADNDGDTNNVQTALGALNAGIISINGGNNNDDVTLNGAVTSSIGSVSIVAPGNLDVNASITAENTLTISEADQVDLAGGVNLTSNAGALSVFTNIGGILLSGATNAVNQITKLGTGGSVNLAAITATNSPDLTVNSTTNITLASVNLNNGDLNVNVDTNNNSASTLTSGALSAGTITVTGTGKNDTATFNSTVTSTAGAISISDLNLADLNGDVTSATSLAITDTNTVDLASSIDLRAQNGALDVATGVGTIRLSGANGTTNIIDGNGDASVSLAAITATNSPSLTVNSEGGISIVSVDITNGAATGNTLSINADNDNDTVNVQTVLGSLDAGIININGGNGTDDVTLNGPVTSSFGAISILAPDILDVNADVTAATTLTITEANTVDLGDNVDLTANNGALNIVNNIGGILLSGATATVNTIRSLAGGGAVNLAPITATNSPDLTVSSTGNVNIASANINNGALDINVDTNNNSSNTGIFGALAAGMISVDTFGGNDDLTFNGAVTTNTGDLTITNPNDVTFNSSITTAGNYIQTNGTGVTIYRGVGTIGADVDVTSGSVLFDGGNLNANAGTGTIDMVATTGGIDSTTAIDGAAELTTGTLNLSANAAIGGTNPIEFTANTVVNALTTGDNITMRSLGDAIVGLITTGGVAGIVTLTSTAAIEEFGSDAAADIVGASADLDAVTGIGNAGQIETAVTAISADTTNGDVNLHNIQPLNTIATSLTTGLGNIRFDQTGGGNLNVQNALTGDGDIDLSNDGANLTTGIVTAGGTGDISYTTTTTGDIILEGLTTAANDDVTIDSAGKIIDGDPLATAADTDIAAANVILTSVSGTGAKGNPIEIGFTGSTLSAQNNGNGDIVIDATSVDDVTVTHAAITGTGDIIINLLNNPHALIVNDASTANGSITFTSLFDLIIDGNVTSGGALAGITLTADSEVNGVGDLIIRGGSLVNGGVGSINLNGANVSVLGTVTGTGPLTLTASGNLLLNSISSGTFNINVGGDILDTNGDLNNLSANNTSFIRAGGIIGTSQDPIEFALTSGDLHVIAQGVRDTVSASFHGSLPGLIVMGNVAPGLILFNNKAISGQTLPLLNTELSSVFNLIALQTPLNYKTDTRSINGLLSGNGFLRRYAAPSVPVIETTPSTTPLVTVNEEEAKRWTRVVPAVKPQVVPTPAPVVAPTLPVAPTQVARPQVVPQQPQPQQPVATQQPVFRPTPQFEGQPQTLQPVPGGGFGPRLFQQSVEEQPTQRSFTTKVKSRLENWKAQAKLWMDQRFASKTSTLPGGGLAPMMPQGNMRLMKGSVEEEKLPASSDASSEKANSSN